MENYKVILKENSQDSIDELLKLSKEILQKKEEDFQKIKNEPAFKRFLKLIMLKRGNEQLNIKNIQDFTTLYIIFLDVYKNFLNKLDSELDNIVEVLIANQKLFGKLYEKIFLNIDEPGDINKIEKNSSVAKCLVSFLTLFMESEDTEDADLQKYNAAVKIHLSVNTAGKMDKPEILSQIDKNFHDAFYRCALEQCIVTKRFDFDDNTEFDFPQPVKDALGYLSVAEITKSKLEDSVKHEYKSFGTDSFLYKYRNNFTGIDETKIEVEEQDIEENKKTKFVSDNGNNQKDADGPFSGIVKLIKKEVPLNKLLGEEIKINDKKYNAVLAALSFLTPKAVIAITKGDQWYLVFSTYALCVYRAGSINYSERYFRIPYIKINENSIATQVIDDGLEFIFKDENGNTKYNFNDKNIDAERLECILSMIEKINNFAETDETTKFSELDEEIKVGYYHIISAILTENNHPLFELFRIVVSDGLEKHWDRIVEEESDIKGFIEQWQKSIPYPSEDAIALKLIRNLYDVLQYTKKKDDLTVKEKKYFSTILSSIERSKHKKLIENQIRCSQIEKRFIEGKPVEDELKKLMNYVSSEGGGFGISSIVNGSIVSIGLTILGPIGWIGRILTFIGYSFIDYMSKRKITDINIVELRSKLYKETILSYKRSLQALELMGNKNLLFEKQLSEGISILQNNSGYNYQINLSKHNDKIIEIVTTFLVELKKKYKDSNLGEVVLVDDLGFYTSQELIGRMTFSLGSEDIKNVIGLYNGKIWIGLKNLWEKYLGILFVKNGFYIKPETNSPIKFVFYSEVSDVVIKGSVFSEIVLKLYDEREIVLDGYNYVTDGTDKLFRQIAAWNKEDLNK